jgi:hypothetical protein
MIFEDDEFLVSEELLFDIVALAKRETPAAFKRIIWLSEHSESEKIRMDANLNIIERAYGKVDSKPVVQVNVDNSRTMNVSSQIAALMSTEQLERAREIARIGVIEHE